MDGGAAQPLAPLWPRKAGQSKLLTASMTSEAPMRARPYAESAAPPFLLPPKLNTVTPRRWATSRDSNKAHPLYERSTSRAVRCATPLAQGANTECSRWANARIQLPPSHTCRYCTREYFLPPRIMPPAITGTILHDLPSTCDDGSDARPLRQLQSMTHVLMARRRANPAS
eukprot:scaffold96587_cov31-Tisochrysis_lutea.AAC.2